MRTSRVLSAFVFTAATLMSVPSAMAQSEQQTSPPQNTQTPQQQNAPSAAPAQPGPQAAIPDQKIEAAAKAVKGVIAIKQNYEQKLAAAPESDKSRIVDEANKALTKAVTDQGLSVDEYTHILQVAQNDPTVHEKIIEKLK